MLQRNRPAYPDRFRERIVELVRAGRSPQELAKEFEPLAQTIRMNTWSYIRVTLTDEVPQVPPYPSRLTLARRLHSC